LMSFFFYVESTFLVKRREQRYTKRLRGNPKAPEIKETSLTSDLTTKERKKPTPLPERDLEVTKECRLLYNKMPGGGLGDVPLLRPPVLHRMESILDVCSLHPVCTRLHPRRVFPAPGLHQAAACRRLTSAPARSTSPRSTLRGVACGSAQAATLHHPHLRRL
jgi:hypothetical protein